MATAKAPDKLRGEKAPETLSQSYMSRAIIMVPFTSTVEPLTLKRDLTVFSNLV
jgi:hypothetical protein